MDFDLSEEQTILQDNLVRLLSDRYDFRKRGEYLKSHDGWSREVWAQFAEMGLLGLPFSEEDGGFGGGPVETMIVMEALGGKLALEPYLATVVLCGGLLRHLGTPAQRQEWIGKIADGSTVLAFAHAERQSRYDLAAVESTATKAGDGWTISGDKTLVLAGDSADHFIVSARTAGGPRDPDGIGLFLVDAKAAGVSRRGYPMQDGVRAAEVGFSSAPAEALGESGKAFPVIARVVDEAIAALCAEAVGAMTALQKLTVDYLKTRKQFGVTIGSFQTLQHRAVDMLIAAEQARSMAMYATMMAAEDDSKARAAATSAAKVQIGKSGRIVGQEATQLHGGIGMTMEYEGGHYFKRLTMINVLFGDVDFHLQRLVQTGGLAEAS